MREDMFAYVLLQKWNGKEGECAVGSGEWNLNGGRPPRWQPSSWCDVLHLHGGRSTDDVSFNANTP